jgi:uncharacterized protein YndB with AHSA1/START domain
VTIRGLGGVGRLASFVEHSNPLTAVAGLKQHYPQWFKTTDRKSADAPWPAGFDPKKAPVYSHSEVFIAAPPEKVFKLLTDAKGWSSYFREVSDVRPEKKGPLVQGSKFSWHVLGTTQKSQVTLYEPNKALGWTAKGLGDTAYHRWYLKPERGGTRLISEEIQQGPGPKVLAHLLNPALTATHRAWMDAIAQKLA